MSSLSGSIPPLRKPSSTQYNFNACTCATSAVSGLRVLLPTRRALPARELGSSTRDNGFVLQSSQCLGYCRIPSVDVATQGQVTRDKWRKGNRASLLSEYRDYSSRAWDLTGREVVVLIVIDQDCKTHIPTSIRVFDQIVGNLRLVMEQREVKTGVILMRT